VGREIVRSGGEMSEGICSRGKMSREMSWHRLLHKCLLLNTTREFTQYRDVTCVSILWSRSGLHQRSCLRRTSSPVTAEIGSHLRAGKPFLFWLSSIQVNSAWPSISGIDNECLRKLKSITVTKHTLSRIHCLTI